MSSREKHIEYSSNVVRTLNPSLSPREMEFDNKIDYLLEDLQQSVSRPGSSLGHNSSSNFSTLNSNRDRDVQYFTSPNSSTKIIRERSVSPTSGRRTFKTAKYTEYSNSNGGTQPLALSSGLDSGYNTTSKVNVETSINQLDSLLDELKVERDLASEPTDHAPITSPSYDSGLHEPNHNSRIIKSSYTTKSTTNSLRPQPRELQFDSPTHHETTRVREVSPGYKKIVETTTHKNVNYDPYVPEKLESNVLDTITRSVNQTAKTLKPVHDPVTVEDPPLDLEGLPLQGNILPPPGTKVTTTVRTYTYEIPGGEHVPSPTTNHSVIYNTSSQHNTLRSNTSTTLDRNRPERDVPPPTTHGETTIYRNETYNNNTTNYLPENRYPESDRPTLPRPGPGKNVTYITETYNNTTTNNQDGPEFDRPFPVPNQQHQPEFGRPFPVPPHHPEPTPVNKTVIYKRNVRDTTTTNYPGQNRPTSPLNGYPPNTNVEVYNEDITNTTNNHLYPVGSPNYPNNGHPHNGHPDGPPKTTYYYKHESSNTTNRRYGPPGSANQPPRNNEPQPIMMTPVNSNNSPSPYPGEPGSVTYKYSTHTTTRNVHQGPDETDNLLKPAPFPAAVPPRPVNVSSPKRLEDLLSNFDDTPQKKGYHEQNMLPDKPYTASPDSLVETAANDQKLPTKNVAGPPVYYPPGEVTLRRSEKGAAMQAGGGYARGGGKYAYEAESKSKSKSSSGAAMVPVCLPLCCAMPCSIM